MDKSSLPEARYELRYTGLFNPGRGYSFPCDAKGRVDLDHFTDRCRNNYFYARAVVGAQLSVGVVRLMG